LNETRGETGGKKKTLGKKRGRGIKQEPDKKPRKLPRRLANCALISGKNQERGAEK